VDEQTRANRPSIASVWARTKIADLYDQHTWDNNPDLATKIKRTALDYQLMSEYTAFVAVDSLAKTAGNFGTTVNVPVPVPDGVRYETTVTE
jgi:Ca-activated chloride channel family protein